MGLKAARRVLENALVALGWSVQCFADPGIVEQGCLQSQISKPDLAVLKSTHVRIHKTCEDQLRRSTRDSCFTVGYIHVGRTAP